MHPTDLEHLAGEDLRRLPMPSAPVTLLPRVLAAVDRWSRRPWYTRAWISWPLAGQVASVAALVLLVVGSAWLLPAMRDVAGNVAGNVLQSWHTASAARGFTDSATRAASSVAATTTAARIVWRTLAEPLALYAFAILLLMSAACAAFGAALNRLAMGAVTSMRSATQR